MQKKREIYEYREKLDKTLSSPELTNHESLKSLIRHQLCSSQECNENTVDKRTDDVSNLLMKLRSVSMVDHQVSKLTNDGDWKLKHDHEDCRVMYREGLNGSPFHTMLVEGYMDGPIQDCLCVSWETSLYQKWWPQFTFPPFRILKSTCLKKIGISEQICLARMKVPWPLTDRELIVHYFAFEYFKDGLVVILMKTISDLDNIEDMIIPESSDAVRMDLLGGFVLQKVTPQRSYFRTIADLDLKLDLMPPSLINFISRQLIGNGFRLYKKSVASVAKFDEDYSRALADPLYTKISQALYSSDKAIAEANEVNGDSMLKNDNGDAIENEFVGSCRRTVPGIEEEEEDCEEAVSSEDGNEISKTHVDIRRQFCVSPEVEQALGTLDRVIDMVRNITPVQEARELSPDQTKQVSLLEDFESLSQRSQMHESSTLSLTQEMSNCSQEEKRDKETGKKQGMLINGKNSSSQRKRKASCFAFKSWL